MRSIQIFATIVLVLVSSCSRNSERSNLSNRDSIHIGDTIDAGHFCVFQATDTILPFQKNGVTIKVVVPKVYVNQFEGFQEFMDHCSPDSLSYFRLETMDVTGDGIIDSCITRIHFRSQVPLIEHIVISQGNEIYHDSLLLNDGGAASEYFGEDELAYKDLKPYSALYVAEEGYGSFVGDKVSTNLHEADEFLNSVHRSEKSYWKKYLHGFKGQCIWNLAIVSPSSLIWDSRAHKFIFYWGE
jgi:hypothetical protein